MKSRIGIGVAVLFLTSALCFGQSLENYLQAREILNSAIAKTGGFANFREIQDLEVTLSGTAFDEGQSYTPFGEWHQREMYTKISYKPHQNMSHQTINTLTIGGLLYDPTFVINSDGKGMLTHASTGEWFELTEFDISILKSIPQLYPPRLFPFAILGNAVRNASSLRYLFKQDDEHYLSITDADGSAMNLVINDESRHLVRLEMLSDHLVFGDIHVGIKYSEYKEVGGVYHPHKLTFSYDRKTFMELSAQIVLNSNLEHAFFEKPGDKEFTVLPTAFNPQALSEGVWLMPVYAGLGTTYNVMMVEFEDHVMVIDTPLFDGYSQGVSQVSKRLASGKPVGRVVVSHYHTDHLGGINFYSSNQIPIVCNSGNAKFIEELAGVKHSIMPNAQSLKPNKPVIEEIDGHKVYSDTKSTVIVYEINNSPHVDKMIVTYLPNEKVMFVADLLMTSYGEIKPMENESLEFLKEFISKQNISVEQLVPAHGKVIAFKDI